MYPRNPAVTSSRAAVTGCRTATPWDLDRVHHRGPPGPTDAFVGVAPDAKILSLRQTSEAFLPVGMQVDPNDPNSSPTAGSLRSLARAIVHAANLGAGVINVSEAACYR